MGRQRNADLSVPSRALSASLSFSQPGCLACVQSVPIWHPLCQQGWEKFTTTLALPLLYLPFFVKCCLTTTFSPWLWYILKTTPFFQGCYFWFKALCLGLACLVPADLAPQTKPAGKLQWSSSSVVKQCPLVARKNNCDWICVVRAVENIFLITVNRSQRLKKFYSFNLCYLVTWQACHGCVGSKCDCSGVKGAKVREIKTWPSHMHHEQCTIWAQHTSDQNIFL